MLKYRLVIIMALIICLLSGCTSGGHKPEDDNSSAPIEASQVTFKKNKEFAFLTGMTTLNTPPLANHYELIVVNGAKLKKRHITTLHLYATQVYGYVNVGTVRAGSAAYKKNKSSARGYVDNTKTYYKMAITKSWRQYLYKNIRKQIRRGVDGIVLDHYDVFTGKPSTYKSLLKIVKYVHKKGLPVYIMNDKQFLTEYVERGDNVIKTESAEKSEDKADKKEKEPEPLPYISGIIEENVFTTLDTATYKTKKQKTSVSSHFKNYLDFCQNHDIKPYIIEYTKNSDWKAVVKAYCRSHDITYYISPSLTCNQE